MLAGEVIKRFSPSSPLSPRAFLRKRLGPRASNPFLHQQTCPHFPATLVLLLAFDQRFIDLLAR